MGGEAARAGRDAATGADGDKRAVRPARYAFRGSHCTSCEKRRDDERSAGKAENGEAQRRAPFEARPSGKKECRSDAREGLKMEVWLIGAIGGRGTLEVELHGAARRSASSRMQ